jgi:predicted HTH transcriptional regulator
LRQQKNDTVNSKVNGTVNAQNLSVALGISLRTTKRDLYVLRDMNLIHYVGSDKTGHWEVIKESD